MPLSKEFYLDEIKSKYPNSYNESLKDLPIKDLEDMLDFLESALEKADGGSIGIEVLFGPKRDEFSIGGQAQKSNKAPYDPRASIQDYAAALQKVGGGTDAQKLQDIGRYGLSQMQNSPNFFKAVGQGINQHMINNQMLRDALDAKRITEDQYKLMGGYDVARLSPKIGLGNIKIGGTPGDVGIASAIYNAIKAGGIGAEKLGIKETDPFNQYGDIGFFGSIAKNYQGAKGLSESDRTLYEDIISGKTQSDIDRFRSGLYAANQVDKATGDRLYGGNIENLFEQYKKSPSTFFYAGDDTQSMYDRFNKYYADGGRVGLFMGGPPLEGTALSIYNSMNAYGFTDQQIANALQEQGLYTPAGSGTTQPEQVTGIINQQIQPSGDNFSPFNPDPNKIKSVKQDPKIQANLEAIQRSQALEKMGIQDPFASEGQPGNEYYGDMMEIDLSPGKQSMFAKAKQGLSGAFGKVKGLMDNPVMNAMSFAVNPLIGGVKGIASFANKMLPTNERAFVENAAGNLGIFVDDIGRIVNMGDYMDPNNIMAGYNLNMITPKTFQKRIDRIRRGRLSDEKKQQRIELIREAQRKIEAAQKLARLQAEQANLAKGRAPSGGRFDGGSAAYTNPDTGVGGGQFTDSLGNVDYQDAYDPGGGEKDGGIIGYKKGGLATMFKKKR